MIEPGNESYFEEQASGFHVGFFGGSGKSDVCGAMPPWGVWGYAPP